MVIPDHLTSLLRNLHADQKATVRKGHRPTDWFQTGKGVCQGCILSPCLFNLYAEYIMRNTRWIKYNLESWLPEETAITHMCRWHHPYGRNRRRTKEHRDEDERGE